MKKNNESGFSLIEIIIVVVILGVISTVAVPYLMKAVHRAEEKNAFGTMRTISAAQVNFLAERGRYARIVELNTSQGGTLGTVSGPDLIRGKFTFQTSGTPSDDDLKEGFTIIGTKPAGPNESPYTVSLDQTGWIDDGIFD